MSNASPNLSNWQNELSGVNWQELTDEERQLWDQLYGKAPLWQPFPDPAPDRPHPQRLALESQADELFYGGAAGGGKTDLMLGLALTAHRKALFLRREAVQLKAAIQRLKEIARGAGWASSGHGGTLTLPDHILELAGCEHEDDRNKYQGRDHDLKLFDEITHFSRSQYRFIIGWNRSSDPKQRCRVVAAGNPPTTPESRWVVEEWAPWLDPTFHDPAQPGELRWYTVLPGQKGQTDQLLWLRAPDPIEHNGEILTPRSRTFIPARVQDNAILMQSGYMAVLQAMPEPLRSQMLYGDFAAGTEDNSWQVIPTAWVFLAQRRWQATPPGPMSSMGVDVAYGGADSTVIVARHGHWFAKAKKYQGEATDSGPKAAALVMRDHKDDAKQNVDGIGYGASCCDSLKEYPGNKNRVNAVNVSSKSNLMDKTGKFKMTNLRSALYWSMREALDPESGDNLALPPDPEMVADLCAPRYTLRASGIAVEAKDDIKKRIGRSPDVGDAVVLARWETKNPWDGFRTQKQEKEYLKANPHKRFTPQELQKRGYGRAAD